MIRLPRLFLVLAFAVSPALAAELKTFSGEPIAEPVEGYSVSINGTVYSNADLENKFFLYETTMETDWGLSGTFVGPKYADVLANARSCACGPLIAKTADGNAVEIPPWPEGLEDALIVTRLNGKPLPLDAFGPFWLVWPSMNEAVKAGDGKHATYWVRGVVDISETK